MVPGLILYRLLKDEKTDYKTTVWALWQLSEYISDDEFTSLRNAADLLNLFAFR